MNARLMQIAEKRTALVSRAAAQRVVLSQGFSELGRPMRSAGHSFDLIRGLPRNPLFIAVMTLIALKAPWRKIVKLPKLAWWGWLAVRAVRRFNQRRFAR